MIEKNRIIVFLGPVGVGKSTQIRYLSMKYNLLNIKFRNTQFKSLHILSNFLLLFFLKLLGENLDNNPRQLFWTKHRRIGRRIWPILVLLDMPSSILRFFFTINIPFNFNQLIFVEEYLPASIIDYSFFRKKLEINDAISSFYMNLLYKLYFKYLRFTTIIFLDASYSKVIQRIKHRNTYTEQLEYIKMQKSLLLSFSKNTSLRGHFFYINTTNKNICEVSKEVFKVINSVDSTYED